MATLAPMTQPTAAERERAVGLALDLVRAALDAPFGQHQEALARVKSEVDWENVEGVVASLTFMCAKLALAVAEESGGNATAADVLAELERGFRPHDAG